MERDLLITFFNGKYTVEALEVGKEYIFYGDFSRRFTGGEMNSPAVISTEETEAIRAKNAWVLSSKDSGYRVTMNSFALRDGGTFISARRFLIALIASNIISMLRSASGKLSSALTTGYAETIMLSPLWGKVAGFLSSKKVILVSGIGYAVGQLFFGIARTEIQFLLARMFAGIFVGGCYVAFLTYTVNCSSEETRGRNLAINATIQSVSASFGYFVGGMVGDMMQLGVGLGAVGSVIGMTKDAINPVVQQAAAVSGWDCSCGQKGVMSNFCPNCGAKKPEPQTGWNCTCGQQGINGNFCPNCGTKKPEAPAAWDCSCGQKGIHGNFCTNCGNKKGE